MLIIEREYSRLEGCHADITLDESTGIVLITYDDLGRQDVMEHLQHQLSQLSLQYTECWLIVLPSDSLRERYGYE